MGTLSISFFPKSKGPQWDPGYDKPLIERLNIPMCIYMGLNHLLSLVAVAYLILPQYHVKASTILFAIFLFVFGQLVGVTAGLHRLFSHRSYQAHFILRFVLMIGTSVAN